MKPLEGNRVTLLKNGEQFFPALVTAIESARVDVRLETYIFEDDATGNLVAAALSRAARRGVKVRVLIDGLGSRHTPVAFFDAMRAAGATVLVFRPEGDDIPARFRDPIYRFPRLDRLEQALGAVGLQVVEVRPAHTTPGVVMVVIGGG